MVGDVYKRNRKRIDAFEIIKVKCTITSFMAMKMACSQSLSFFYFKNRIINLSV